MAHVIAELRLCACCVSVAANGDSSGCRDYYGHPEHALTSSTGYVVATGPIEGYETGQCDGCGWDNVELVRGGVILEEG